ncbi:MAG: polyprenyl synthetase family protein [Bacteroidales bacterium]|nr:polyprenyl synthetase family protein [Bacteroidales bacterium]
MKREMEEFESRFAEALRGSVLPMDEVLRYVEAAPGKRLRPWLVFLSARLFGEINDTTRRTALFVELLHTATLIHDDVVDRSDMRRGQPSVNARWNSQVAVLAGDYLLAKAMRLLSNPEDHLILKEMLDVAMKMSEGELLQNGKLKVESGKMYLDIVTRKTARLIQACCVCGAMSVNSLLPSSCSLPLADFGLNYGLVFQMHDDIDDGENVDMAKALLPVYQEKALKALEALELVVSDKEALESLRTLVE